MKKFYVYILANNKGGVIYTGFTGSLHSRIMAHKEGTYDGFTKKYSITNLVYLEAFDQPRFAIMREKQIKHWKREWRVQLIESMNPDWEDLFYKTDFGL